MSFTSHTRTAEVVSKKLATLAILSAIGVAFALWRALRSWFATRSLRREWLSNAVQIILGGISIPTFRISNSFPIIAVVGTVRPRLFIAEHVLEILNEEELTAAIAHEGGHLSAHDNFKRSLLRACRDVLMIVPCGRSLDRAWAEAAECAADEHAAQQNAETALNLASALVKIAKMVPVGARASVPMAAFLVGVEETRGVKARVRRLLEIASSGCRRSVPNSDDCSRPARLRRWEPLFALAVAAGRQPTGSGHGPLNGRTRRQPSFLTVCLRCRQRPA